MKFAICNEVFEGWAFDEMCRFSKKAGYCGVELAPFTLAPRITDLTQARRSELRAQAADAGIEIIGLHWLLAGTDGLYLTSPDAGVRSRTGDYIVRLAEATRDLGGSLMVSADRAFDWSAETFRRVMPAVADCGVRFCMEPLAPSETNFINTCAEGARLASAVNHPSFVLHLDVKAMSSESIPVVDLIRAYGPAAGHFHANDANLRGPGFGEIDFVPIFKALRDSGYDRWVSVEVFDYKPDPQTIAVESAAYMERALQAAG